MHQYLSTDYYRIEYCDEPPAYAAVTLVETGELLGGAIDEVGMKTRQELIAEALDAAEEQIGYEILRGRFLPRRN